jgi:hypothetical protein
MSTLYTVHKQLALKRFSPDGSGPKLSILHGFQMLSGRKYVSFKILGWEKPEEDVSKQMESWQRSAIYRALAKRNY